MIGEKDFYEIVYCNVKALILQIGVIRGINAQDNKELELFTDNFGFLTMKNDAGVKDVEKMYGWLKDKLSGKYPHSILSIIDNMLWEYKTKAPPVPKQIKYDKYENLALHNVVVDKLNEICAYLQHKQEKEN